MSIQGQLFIEADWIDCHDQGLGYAEWDGILGLALASLHSRSGVQNPFLNIVSQKLLDQNIFSLKLSHGEHDAGEIMFGAINHSLYTGNLKTLPLQDKTKFVAGRWQVKTNAVSAGDFFVSLNGRIASLVTDFPLIALPDEIDSSLSKYLGMEQIDGYLVYRIGREKRTDLRDVTISLGGHDFVLTPYQYTLEVDMEELGGHTCLSAFTSSMSYTVGSDSNTIILGSAFMRSVYGVFDLDERTISRE